MIRGCVKLTGNFGISYDFSTWLLEHKSQISQKGKTSMKDQDFFFKIEVTYLSGLSHRGCR